MGHGTCRERRGWATANVVSGIVTKSLHSSVPNGLLNSRFLSGRNAAQTERTRFVLPCYPCSQFPANELRDEWSKFISRPLRRQHADLARGGHADCARLLRR